ncbi:hypothetical protein Tco_1398183, partial [Tanacetum coccineum]
MMGTTMGTIRFAIHGDPDRYRTAIGIARTRSKIAKGLAIPVTMVSFLYFKRGVSAKGSKAESIIVQLQSICQEFEATSKDPEGHSVDDLITEFRSCLSAKVIRRILLDAVFEDKWFAHAVKERTLDNLITEILIWLLDERVPRMHDGSQLLKVLNVLMLKILDNAERTSSFVVLISLLIPLHPSRWPSPPSNESFATRNMKFSNLVVKCLIKLTKDLQSTIDEVDLDHILQIIHVYLQELGIDEIRR